MQQRIASIKNYSFNKIYISLFRKILFFFYVRINVSKYIISSH